MYIENYKYIFIYITGDVKYRAMYLNLKLKKKYIYLYVKLFLTIIFKLNNVQLLI